jgi:two-component system, OmpR family, sensor histidine kinase KdpD
MRGYGRVALVLALCTVLGTVVLDWLSITDVAMLYLLGVGVIASWATRRQAIVAAVLSVALFDFFFVPPRFTFAVSDLHYVFTFGVMLVTALVISRLAERFRTEAKAAETRERGTATLYPMLGDLGDAKTLDDVTRVISDHVRAAFGADSRVLLRQAGHLAPVGVASPQPEPSLRLADLAYQSWEPAGFGTRNFPNADAQYLPLVGSHGRLGVLEVRPDDPARFVDPAVQWLLQTFAAQAALAIERVRAVA